jgi:hypothetical protein
MKVDSPTDTYESGEPRCHTNVKVNALPRSWSMAARPWTLHCLRAGRAAAGTLGRSTLGGVVDAAVLLILVSSLAAAADNWKMESQTPVMETTSPPESAYPGRTWRSTTVHITNISAQSLFVVGYAKDRIFVQVYRSYPLDDAWKSLNLAYCGTGARTLEIKPGEDFAVVVSIPTMYQSEVAKVEFDEYSGIDHGTSRVVTISGISVK